MIKLDLHPSGVNGFFDCSYKWFRDNLHNPIRRVGTAAHFGTGLHKSAEVFYKETIAKQQWQNYNTAYADVAIESFRENIKDSEPDDIKDVDINDLESELVNLSKAYINNASTLDSIPQSVENSYTLELAKDENIDININGTLDIEYSDSISDIKTMNRLNNPSKYLIQQGIYAILKESANKDNEVKDLKIHRVVRAKQHIDSISILGNTKNPFTTIQDIKTYCKQSIDTIAKTLKEFDKTGNEILFRGNPNSLLCGEKYCPYYKECKWKI